MENRSKAGSYDIFFPHTCAESPCFVTEPPNNAHAIFSFLVFRLVELDMSPHRVCEPLYKNTNVKSISK